MSIGVVFVTILRVCQFVSYIFTAFHFMKSSVLPALKLSSEFVKTSFQTRRPEVHWFGRGPGQDHHTIVTPVEGLPPFTPRYRRGEYV